MIRPLRRVVAVGAAFFLVVSAGSCTDDRSGPRGDAGWPGDVSGDAGQGGDVDVGGLGFFYGRPDAPLQVVEFTDPACPYCARFHEDARDSLFATYVATGRARWITIPWESGQYATSRPAVVAVECAPDAETADRITEALYAVRDRWVGAGPTAAAEIVRETTIAAGLPESALDTCMDDPSLAARIDRADSLATALGIRGTPTYLIDGFPMMGAVPFDFARRAFDERLTQLRGDSLR